MKHSVLSSQELLLFLLQHQSNQFSHAFFILLFSAIINIAADGILTAAILANILKLTFLKIPSNIVYRIWILENPRI